MDKSWVKEYRFSEKYELGVENFLSFAIDNSAGRKFIPCPCSRCVNLKKLTIGTIRIHLFKHGFSLSYTTWIWHGENSSSPFIGTSTVSVPTPCSDSEMFDMCEAAFKEGYSGDFLDDFHKFVKDGAQPLYKNSENSKLESLVKLQYLKARYGMSRSCFSEMLIAVGSLLPKDNVLPKNVYESKKIMNALGLKYEKIHACPNDCILYRKEYADVVSCPKCGLSRWKLKNDKTIKDGQPAKILWYFPIISRFKRLFNCPDNAEMLTWHEDSRSKDGQLRHPTDSPSWKLIDYKWPEFANDSRNLRLGLSADGINPHSTMSSRYSCWPVILVTYNLPPWLCMKRKFMMLTLLISGPKQPGNDIDVYLQPLIDDLRTLWDGVSGVYDAFRKETFTLRAVLLWTINDFPAYGNLSGCTTKGYKACPICGENTSATYLPHSRKLSYASHRKFLPHYHPYRKQKRTFNNQQELGVAPTPLRGEELLSRVENINYVYGKGKKKKNEERCAWKKKSIFFDLEYWQFLHVRHNLDVMHIEKNICESVVGTLLDIPSKTKDSVAARLDMVDIGVRIDLGPTSGERRTYIPAAPYTLSKQEKFDICNSLLGIKVPDGYSSNINNLVSMEDLKLYGLKSHDCHTLMQQLLPIAIRSGLPKNVRISIMRLCFFFNALCSKVVDVSKLDKLQSDLVLTLCELEKIFPPSFFDIMVHLSVHLVREVRLCGPVFYRWMYPFERYMKVLKGYVKSRIHPEGCIAESYIAEEAVEFCSNYSAHINAIGIPKSRDNISGPISRAILKTVDEDTLMEAHLHVLFNNAEVDPYITKHKRLIEQQYAGKHKSGKWLQNEQNTTFADWFQSEGACELALDKVDNVVAFGTIVKGTELTHGVPLPAGSAKVILDGAIQADAEIPFPLESESVKVGESIGNVVAWPLSLVIQKPKQQQKRKKNPQKSVLPFEVHKMVPKRCSLLYKYAKTTMSANNLTLQYALSHEVFGHEKECYVLPADIINFLEMNMIGQAVITAYMAYLHDVVRERGELDIFAFVDPSRTHNCERPEFINSIVDRLKEGKSDRLFLIPYNPGAHWLLTTVYQNEICVLDSLSRPFHYKAWENAIISAVRTFNAVTGAFNKPPRLTYLADVPKQPGGTECGYFVMRYMKEIINDDSLSFSTKWAIRSRSRLEFTQQEIDEMRIELCEYIENLV